MASLISCISNRCLWKVSLFSYLNKIVNVCVRFMYSIWNIYINPLQRGTTLYLNYQCFAKMFEMISNLLK
jgi:hypothetical protein